MKRYLSESAKWLGCDQPSLSHKGTAIAVATFLGIVFGWFEAAQHFTFRYSPQVLAITKVSPGIFWVAPVLTAGLTAAVAVVLVLPGLVIRTWPSVALAVLSSSFVGAYGVATLTNKIHKGAAAVLALGVAVAAWRILRLVGVGRFVRRGLPPTMAAVALIWVLLSAWTWVEERRLAGTIPAPPAAPSVVLIVLDTVRADHLSLDGYPRNTTPNIDRWASEGTIFENAWSTSSWTLPAHASLLTGRPAYQHGADREARLDGRLPVVPEVLASRGFLTGAFIGNNIWINPGYGFNRGFQQFSVHTSYSDGARTVWGRKLFGTLENDLRMRHLPVRKNAAQVNADLFGWIDRHPGRPFFALLNYFDAHDPYDPPAPFDSRFKGEIPDARPEKQRYRASINAYDGLIAYIDTEVGALRGELERRGLTGSTIVILTADHGEGLGDHKQPQHGKNLHRSVARVPLIVIGPGVAQGQRVRAAVSLEQVPATLIELLDLPVESPFPGDSLFRRAAAADQDPTPVLAELKHIGGELAAKSLVTARWQYIWNASDSREELYDLERDPREVEDLAHVSENSELLINFRNRLLATFPGLLVRREVTTSR
jgi:arylsulfatase A-like enzyme